MKYWVVALSGLLAACAASTPQPQWTEPVVTGEKVKAEKLGKSYREAIQARVKAAKRQVRYCYEKELEYRPSLAGTVEMQWVITQLGQVAEVQIQESDLGDDAVHACLKNAVRRFRFPQPKKGTAVVVKFPFRFLSARRL